MTERTSDGTGRPAPWTKWLADMQVPAVAPKSLLRDALETVLGWVALLLVIIVGGIVVGVTWHLIEQAVRPERVRTTTADRTIHPRHAPCTAAQVRGGAEEAR